MNHVHQTLIVNLDHVQILGNVQVNKNYKRIKTKGIIRMCALYCSIAYVLLPTYTFCVLFDLYFCFGFSVPSRSGSTLKFGPPTFNFNANGQKTGQKFKIVMENNKK